jgi:quinoprotein glucose dehydrogenase
VRGKAYFAGAALALALAGTQAIAQDEAYSRSCAACHGPELRGGESGPPLIGSAFQAHWSALAPGELDRFTRQTMPPTNPGSLSNADYAQALIRIRRANGWPVSAAMEAAAGTQGPVHHTHTDWLNNRGDAGSTSYSPLDQINGDNVRSLRIAWRWKSDNFGPAPEYYYRPTPVIADGVLYVTAGLRRDVVAIDPATGETLWMYRLDEGERGVAAPRRNSGRGVSYWRSRDSSEPPRIFTVTPGFQLVALDAKTGLPIASFGKSGIVDLKEGLPRVAELPKTPPGSSSPPVIVGNSVIVGVAFSAGGAPPS